MERHITDTPNATAQTRLPHYLAHERRARLNGPHRAVTLLRRLPRGVSGASQRMKSYLRIDRFK